MFFRGDFHLSLAQYPGNSNNMKSLSSLVRRDSGIDSSSLTFGFSFMGILLIMLIAASLLQRHIATRERLQRMRLNMAFDGLATEPFGFGLGQNEVPKLWDVQVRRTVNHDGKDPVTRSVDEGVNAGAGKRSEKELWEWKDMQPLAAYDLRPRMMSSPPSPPPQQPMPRYVASRLWPSKPVASDVSGDAEVSQRMPTHVSILIAMPVSSNVSVRKAHSLEKSMINLNRKHESLETGLHGMYYEIGIAEVTK